MNVGVGCGGVLAAAMVDVSDLQGLSVASLVAVLRFGQFIVSTAGWGVACSTCLCSPGVEKW
jgi:hypothetical protein